MGAQQELGLLSERWAWIGTLDSARVSSDGPHLTDEHGREEPRTQFRSQSEASMKQPVLICVMLIVCVLAMTGCATVQKILPTTAWHQARVRNEGYSL